MIIFFEISFKQLIYLAVKIIISFLHNIHEENLSKINRQIINARNYFVCGRFFMGKSKIMKFEKLFALNI